jgi:hypothetical protein
VIIAVALLAFTLLRPAAPPEELPAQQRDAQAPRSTSKRRPLPRFRTVESPAAPVPPVALTPPPIEEAPPAPPPPPPDEKTSLKERASKDGFLFREAGSKATYVVQGGAKFWIPSVEEFQAMGHTWDKVEVVPPGSLSFLRDRPPEKTLMRERDDNHVYYFENGQKRWVSSPENLQKMGFSFSDVKIVPSGGLKSESTGAPIQ